MRFEEFNQPAVGDIIEIELGEELVEAIITAIKGDEIVAETDSISGANLLVESYGKYWCSTDKKWKERQGPKQTREAASPAQQAAIAIAKKKKQGVAEAFGPLPKDNQQIRLGKYSVDIERVGLNKNYIGFTWHDSHGQEHYEEVPVGDLGSYDDLIDRIKGEIKYQERRLKQGVAEEKQRLDPKCWDGYKKQGTKMKGGVRVNNCVKESMDVNSLAKISDEALDKAYGYGRSTPSNTFGWQANVMSATYAKKLIDAGETDIEKIADAIHKGWNVTAQKFVQDPNQFDDTEKLRAAGKLDAKLEQRAKLMKINYAQLPDDEKEKDRVVARALLDALKQGVAEGYDNVGNKIKALYQKIYDQGDDSIDYMYHESPVFAQISDEYEGDLDSIIAEVDPSELQVIANELEAYLQGQGVAEAEYQGRNVPLGKPMQGDVKKFKVYVRDPSTGNVKKVNFGDPNMRIKKSNPKRRKSFRARHNCSNPGPRTKARYWSCRKW